MPRPHNLDEYLHACLDEAGLSDAKGWLFRSAVVRTGQLSYPMRQADVYRMSGRGALDANVWTKIGCHSFRATGIAGYLRTAASWRSRRWRTMRAPGPRGSMTGEPIRFHSMKSSSSSDLFWLKSLTACISKAEDRHTVRAKSHGWSEGRHPQNSFQA